MKSVLLLNCTGDVLNFVNERKALKLWLKERVDIVSTWVDESFDLIGKTFFLPAIIKLRYFVNRKFQTRLTFSRLAVLKRDCYHCSYCGHFVRPNNITVDHIIPKSRGGGSTFANCVAACRDCNRRKANKTPEEAEMKLLVEPITPRGYLYHIPMSAAWHSDWDKFLFGEVESEKVA
jgi:5-methylcytosine-specific restriction endonuclease McrA